MPSRCEPVIRRYRTPTSHDTSWQIDQPIAFAANALRRKTVIRLKDENLPITALDSLPGTMAT
ncbi:MAG: hypothetical protein AAF989_08645 [Planctomycetota bacterium]